MNKPSSVPSAPVAGPARLVSAVLIAALAGSVHVVAQGKAATITNRDAREYRLSIEAGAVTDDRILKQNEALKDICPKGCVVRLNNDTADQYELEGSDVVSIEDGFVYYDGLDSNAPQAAPGASAPAAK